MRIFGVRADDRTRRLVVLDKSFLQGVQDVELEYYTQQGWVFVIADVFWYEHLRKWDRGRFSNLVKLKGIENKILLLPGIGEMFRAESSSKKPASQVLHFRKLTLTEKVKKGSRFFEIDEDTRSISAERTLELKDRLDAITEIWLDFKKIPEFANARSEDMPAIVHAKSIQIRDDPDDMRGFYDRHRHRLHPPGDLIDEQWAFFRWIQVQLLAGLDFFAGHGLGAPFNRERIFHELLDLDYLIPSLIVGGLATREKKMADRFKFLRSNGVVLR